jgi:pheromone shutdown protein TraB
METYREKEGFYIVGVIHRDEEGASLLLDWIEKIEPDVITLEFSHYGMTFRKERGAQLRMRIDKVLEFLRENGELCQDGYPHLLYSFIDMPYEYEVTRQYCNEHAIPLYLIDMDIFSYLKLKKVEELLSPDNIKKILSEPEKRDSTDEKVLARIFFEKGIKILPYTEEMYIRDRYMSVRIGTLMKYYKNRRFIHVCGWHHLQDPYHLYSHLNPVKIFFYDKTFCF